MGLIENDVLRGFAEGYSICGLIFVIPICFVFRQYLRFLDHLQILYLLYVTITPQQTIFSSFLGTSWINFSYNFYSFCQGEDFVCTCGFPLSFATCLAGALVILWIVILVEQRYKSQAKYESIYSFFKGLIRWFYLPLTYYSLYFMILSIQGKKQDIVPSTIVFCLCCLFPLLQLIAYKCIETDEIWNKWLQFTSYARLFVMVLLATLAQTMQSSIPFYIMLAVYLLYGIFYLCYHEFILPIMGRILYCMGEMLMLCMCVFYVFSYSLVVNYNLDLFFISFVLLMDLCEFIGICHHLAKNGKNYPLPEKSIDSEQNEKKLDSRIELQQFRQKKQSSLSTITSEKRLIQRRRYRKRYNIQS